MLKVLGRGGELVTIYAYIKSEVGVRAIVTMYAYLNTIKLTLKYWDLSVHQLLL